MYGNGDSVRCIVCREKMGFKEEMNIDGMMPVCGDECADAYKND